MQEFHHKKKYGQNFITNKAIINSIIAKSEIKEETLVIEIGPGKGILTNELAKQAKQVIAYEIDQTLKPILEENKPENVHIIYQDILKSNIKEDIKQYKYKHLYLIANLPYYITTPIILKMTDENLPIEKIIVMVQKEVGNRFNAKPNTKEYNSLTVYLNYHYNITKIMNVSKNSFKPKPKVDSIVIKMEKKKPKEKVKNNQNFNKLLKDSFKQKRKTLKNNLKEYNLEKIEEILEKHNLNLQVRAEALPLEIFVEISNKLS